MASTPQQRMREAIDTVLTGPHTSGLQCRITDSASGLIGRLRQGHRKSAAAISIITTALDLGYSDEAAIHIAVISAPESDFIPNAVNGVTGASGYFQLHPKYWDVSGPTDTDYAMRRQLREIRRRYGDGVLDDLAIFYGTHFYPGLGAGYAISRVLGVQPGSETYGQYAFSDSIGSVFHSPLIMAVYAVLTFEEITGVKLKVEIPQLQLAVSQVSSNGRKVLRTAALSSEINPSKATRFAIDPMAERMEIFLLDTASSIDFSAISPSYDDVEWTLSGKSIALEISERDNSISGRTVHPLFSDTIRLFTIIEGVPENIVAPSLDTLIHRFRNGDVDMEIIKSCIFSLIFTPEGLGPSMIRGKTTQRIEETPASSFLRQLFTVDADFLSFMNEFSNEELGAIFRSLLYAQVTASSTAGLVTQLANHRALMITFDVQGGEDERFPDVWDMPWFAHDGVLYPASILVTPGFDVGTSRLSLIVGQRFADSLFKWTRQVVSDSGISILINAIKRIMPSKALETKERQRRPIDE